MACVSYIFLFSLVRIGWGIKPAQLLRPNYIMDARDLELTQSFTGPHQKMCVPKGVRAARLAGERLYDYGSRSGRQV